MIGRWLARLLDLTRPEGKVGWTHPAPSTVWLGLPRHGPSSGFLPIGPAVTRRDVTMSARTAPSPSFRHPGWHGGRCPIPGSAGPTPVSPAADAFGVHHPCKEVLWIPTTLILWPNSSRRP